MVVEIGSSGQQQLRTCVCRARSRVAARSRERNLGVSGPATVTALIPTPLLVVAT
jgi:hypothetical protein